MAPPCRLADSLSNFLDSLSLPPFGDVFGFRGKFKRLEKYSHSLGAFAMARNSRKPRRKRRSRSNQRRILLEALEPRVLLAADQAAKLQFSDAFRSGLEEIERILGAVEQAPGLQTPMPWLQALRPESVGDAPSLQATAPAELFELRSRFQTQIVDPVVEFIESRPTATANELAAQFPFLNTVHGLPGIAEGLTIDLDVSGNLATTLTGFLEPLLSKAPWLEPVVSDSIGTQLDFEFSPEIDFRFLLDEDGLGGVLIPSFSLDVTRDSESDVDFAAQLGMLAGVVDGGSIDLDMTIVVDTQGLFAGSVLEGALQRLATVEELRQISATEVAAGLRLDVSGDGLSIDFPFQFELNGFDTGGLLPRFQAIDGNLLDSTPPTFHVAIPSGAPYTVDDLLGFRTIDATSVLTSLEQLGIVLGTWEEGDLLNLPIPLAKDLTLGDAVGLAEGYGSAVLQFLRDENGFPSFHRCKSLRI